MARTHELPADRVHYTWDARNEPAVEIESGDSVVLSTRDVSDNQITAGSDATAIGAVDWDRVYPLGGPIAVADAEPGDTLAVELDDRQPGIWGWTATTPGLGLLADDFADAYPRVFALTGGDTTPFRDDIAIPIEPFLGTMGVCPAGAAQQAVMPPGRFGGNLDTRQLVRGSTLYL